MGYKIVFKGAVEWNKRFGGLSVEEGKSIIQTQDSGYIFAAHTYSTDGLVTGNHGAFDCWVVKLNKAGDIEWENCYGGKESDFPASIIQDKDGDYIFCASTNSNEKDVDGNHGETDYWIVKLSDTGIIKWQKCLGGSKPENPSSIQETVDNGFIVAGDARSNDGDVKGIHLVGVPDYWIVKLDSSGFLQWQKCYGGTVADVALSVVQAKDGGYAVTGQTYSDDGDIHGYHGQIYGDAWTIKLFPDVLPVSLLSFNATQKEKSVVLNWQTAQENNNDYFAVERSADSRFRGNDESNEVELTRKL